VVAPALEQGQVDLVVDYAGSLLDYLGGSAAETHGRLSRCARRCSRGWPGMA
jgi:hypothetical protein